MLVLVSRESDEISQKTPAAIDRSRRSNQMKEKKRHKNCSHGRSAWVSIKLNFMWDICRTLFRRRSFQCVRWLLEYPEFEIDSIQFANWDKRKKKKCLATIERRVHMEKMQLMLKQNSMVIGSNGGSNCIWFNRADGFEKLFFFLQSIFSSACNLKMRWIVTFGT